MTRDSFWPMLVGVLFLVVGAIGIWAAGWSKGYADGRETERVSQKHARESRLP